MTGGRQIAPMPWGHGGTAGGGLVYTKTWGNTHTIPYTLEVPLSPGRPVQASVARGHWKVVTLSGKLYVLRGYIVVMFDICFDYL